MTALPLYWKVLKLEWKVHLRLSSALPSVRNLILSTPPESRFFAFWPVLDPLNAQVQLTRITVPQTLQHCIIHSNWALNTKPFL